MTLGAGWPQVGGEHRQVGLYLLTLGFPHGDSQRVIEFRISSRQRELGTKGTQQLPGGALIFFLADAS